MRKRILQISVIMLSFAGTAYSQTADNFILPKHPTFAPADHYGQAISKFDNYVLVGGPDDDINEECRNRSQMAGAAVLYKDGKVFRKYTGYSSFINGFEVGWRAGQSVAMGSDWLAVAAPNAIINDGAVLLARKDNSSGSYDFSLYFNAILTQPSVTDIGKGSLNQFGSSVAMGRNTLVVGARNATYKGVSCGVVFIYKLMNNSWQHVRTLVSPYSTQDGDFGAAVAISDDETKIIVGAPDNIYNTGSAHIYHLDNAASNTWNLKGTFLGNVHKLVDLKFGASVDITNDRAIVGGNNSARSEGNYSVVSFLTYNHSSGWKVEQSIYKPSVRDVAMEGTKALIGEAWYLGGEGRIVHMERRGTQQYKPWIATATVGLAQEFARTGYAVDLANNVAVAGVFGYDWADIFDPCNGSGVPSPYDETGAALSYNFDQFYGKFHKSDQSALRFASEQEDAEESFAAPAMVVSPNPAEKGLVEIHSKVTITEVIATNTLGVSITLIVNNNTVDISALDSGVYFLQMKSEGGSFVQRLVVK